MAYSAWFSGYSMLSSLVISLTQTLIIINLNDCQTNLQIDHQIVLLRGWVQRTMRDYEICPEKDSLQN